LPDGRIRTRNYDTEVIEILRASFSTDTTLAGACARLVAVLMKEWGLIVLEPHSLVLEDPGCAGALSALPASVLQCSLLPVIAAVIDPFETDAFTGAQSFLRDRNLVGPMAWPRQAQHPRQQEPADSGPLRPDLKRLYAGQMRSSQEFWTQCLEEPRKNWGN
jgi:hypothetical protein